LLAPSMSVAFSLLHHPATPELYPLSLHDALPISGEQLGDGAYGAGGERRRDLARSSGRVVCGLGQLASSPDVARDHQTAGGAHRSEEHTSELQSLTNLVCRLLLEKKNTSTPTPRH